MGKDTTRKHVDQFPDKINCVTLHLVGYILEYRKVEYCSWWQFNCLHASINIKTKISGGSLG
jgi:hypothetical protein